MQISSGAGLSPAQSGSGHPAGFAAATANPAAGAASALPQGTADLAPAATDDAVTLSREALALQRGERTASGTPLTYDTTLPRQRDSGTSTAASSRQLQFPDVALLASLRAAGIPTQPAFELAVNPATGQTNVIGTRPDASRIEDLINHPSA